MDNDVLIEPSQKPKHKIYIVLLVALILVAAGLSVFVLQKNGQLPSAVSTVEDRVMETPVQEGVVEGSINLSLDSQTASVSAPVKFTVKLDSNKRGVVGMDAVVAFDKEAFTVGQVSSLLPGFTAVSSSRKDYLEVTSSKDPQTLEIPVLANTEVFSFTLTPRKAGVYKVELLTTQDKSSTKYIDSETNIFLPTVNSVMVTVK